MPKSNPPDDDKAFFNEAMRFVTPLKSKKTRVDLRGAPPAPTVRPQSKSSPVSVEETYLSNHYHDEVGSDSTLNYATAGVPHKQRLQLRKGAIPWESRLDLHRLTIEQARTALCHHIQEQIEQHHRCMLLIHGKGGATGEPPILKNHVNHWLKQLPSVLAFHSALPSDGGNGALYVLLKRIRQ